MFWKEFCWFVLELGSFSIKGVKPKSTPVPGHGPGSETEIVAGSVPAKGEVLLNMDNGVLFAAPNMFGADEVVADGNGLAVPAVAFANEFAGPKRPLELELDLDLERLEVCRPKVKDIVRRVL